MYTSSDQNRLHLDWVRCTSCTAYIERADAIRTGGICPNCGESEGVRVDPDEDEPTGFVFEVLHVGTVDSALSAFDRRFTKQPDIPDDFADRVQPGEVDPRD